MSALPHPISRRALLHVGGALAVSFSIGRPARAADAQPARGRTVAPDEVNGFIVIDAQGQVTLYSGKVELGTGVLTAMTQIAAEELSVPFDRVTTVQGDTRLTPDQRPTYASLSIQQGGMQIRRAAATAREALIDRAARRLGVARANLRAQGGMVEPARGGQGLSYAQLVAGEGLSLKVDPAVRLKDPKAYSIVGKAMPRLDIPAKIFGQFSFVHDVKLPGMLHARMVHPAAAGAKLEAFDDARCRSIPGYVRAVRQGDFLAVVASDEWAAVRASTAIAATWSTWAGLPDENGLVGYLRSAKVDRNQVLQTTGDSLQALSGEGRRAAPRSTGDPCRRGDAQRLGLACVPARPAVWRHRQLGMGTYHGEEGFRELSHAKPVFKRQRWFPIGLFYPPYGNWVQRLLMRLYLGKSD